MLLTVMGEGGRMSRNKCLNTAAVKECEECAEGDCFLHGKRMGKLIID